MAGNSIGEIFRVTTWGESHGPAIGLVIDGCPAGLELSEDEVQRELERRRGGASPAATPRKEPDRVRILSGVFGGRTTGAPISMMIENVDVDSSTYEDMKDVFRPGHADYTYFAKYGIRDYRGGGRASGRETACRVAAGAVARKLLHSRGISVKAYTIQIGRIRAERMDMDEVNRNPLRCPDGEAAERMMKAVEEVRERKDSLGGVVEVLARGAPPGLGEPVFGKLDAEMAGALMSIGAVKGVEFGRGFGVAELLGSENDPELFLKEGRVVSASNSAGGIVGGISTGEDIVARIAVKPTSSIGIPRRTVNERMEEAAVQVEGRHDPVICPRIVPVAEAMVALVLADYLLRHRSSRL